MTIVAPTAPRILLNMDNLLDAFEGYVPVALRGMSLNKSNSVDFTHVGGMKEAKKILTEFILWPSKVRSFHCNYYFKLRNFKQKLLDFPIVRE